MRSVPLPITKLLREGRAIAAKISPKYPDAVAWVWVGPYKKGNADLRADGAPELPWIYLVQSFEAPKKLIDLQYEVSDEELLHNERYRVHSLEEVDDLLERLVGDPSKFKLLADYDDYFPF